MKTKPITTITTSFTVPTTPASLRPPKAEAFIGIDFYKRYSVYHGLDLAKGRINHTEPEEFAALVGRWKRPRVIFEASMNCLRKRVWERGRERMAYLRS